MPFLLKHPYFMHVLFLFIRKSTYCTVVLCFVLWFCFEGFFTVVVFALVLFLCVCVCKDT